MVALAKEILARDEEYAPGAEYEYGLNYGRPE